MCSPPRCPAEGLHIFSCSRSPERCDLTCWPWLRLVAVDGGRGRSPFPPSSYLSLFTPLLLTIPNLAALQLFEPAFCRRADKARAVVCVLGLGRESIACKGKEGAGDQKEDEKNARVYKSCNWSSQRANVPDRAGDIHRRMLRD